MDGVKLALVSREMTVHMWVIDVNDGLDGPCLFRSCTKFLLVRRGPSNRNLDRERFSIWCVGVGPLHDVILIIMNKQFPT